MKKSIFCFCLLLNCCAVAQLDVQSANPPSIKWQKIENDHSIIIYPKGLEKYAFRFASVVDYIDQNKKGSIGSKSLKIPIVIHGLSMEPNGFVAGVPFRSEIYTTPLPNWNNLGRNNWLDVLALHEYRHVLQSSNSDVGFTKLFRILTGRAGWGASMRFTEPAWFSEGDAVVSESLQSEAGRGRMPSFTSEVRANMYAEKYFRYNKSRNGSYVTQMPSHYPFGYILNLYARKEFGNDIWAKVIHDSNFYKSVFYPFSGAIKRNTGLTANGLYKAAYADFNAGRAEIIDNISLTKFDSLTFPSKKQVSYYTYPKILPNGEIIVRKSSYSDTPSLIKINIDGSEEKITDVGIGNNPFISYSNTGVVWLENQTNPRWGNVDFARIVHADFVTGKKSILQEKERIYFAAIDSHNERFIVVKQTLDLTFELNEFDVISGNLLKNLDNSEGWEIGYPMYDVDGLYLYYVAKKDNQMAIIKHDLATNQKAFLTDWENSVFVEPSQSKDQLFFRANIGGIDNIYAVSKNGDKKLKKVTSVPVAAGYPSVSGDGENLVFSNLTNTGYHVGKMNLNASNFVEETVISANKNDIYSDLNSLSENHNILNEIPDKQYAPKSYSSFFRGWKFHSWGLEPAFASSSGNSSKPSLTSTQVYVTMDDILGANALQISYSRFFSEEENAYGIDYTMGRFFAKLNMAYQYRGRKVLANRGNRILNFDELEAKVGLSVPLEVITGNYTWNYEMVANWKGIQQFRSDDFFEFDNSKFGLYELKGGFSVNRQKAYQNLQSKFGGGLGLTYAESFQSGIAKLFKVNASILLPGIAKNHGIEIQQGYYDESNKNLYRFPNTFSLGRGHNIFGIQNAYSTSANYKMPLFYPDFGINGITYIKRVRMNLYFDTTHAKDSAGETDLRTAGAEFRFDQTVFNLFDLPIGFRVGYRFPNEFLPSLDPVYVNLIIGN